MTEDRSRLRLGMVVLVDLVRQNLIRPWGSVSDSGDWRPGANEAVSIEGKTMACHTGFAGGFYILSAARGHHGTQCCRTASGPRQRNNAGPRKLTKRLTGALMVARLCALANPCARS